MTPSEQEQKLRPCPFCGGHLNKIPYELPNKKWPFRCADETCPASTCMFIENDWNSAYCWKQLDLFHTIAESQKKQIVEGDEAIVIQKQQLDISQSTLHKLLHQLKKVTHQLRMRKDKTESEINAIATAEKVISKTMRKSK